MRKEWEEKKKKRRRRRRRRNVEEIKPDRPSATVRNSFGFEYFSFFARITVVVIFFSSRVYVSRCFFSSPFFSFQWVDCFFFAPVWFFNSFLDRFKGSFLPHRHSQHILCVIQSQWFSVYVCTTESSRCLKHLRDVACTKACTCTLYCTYNALIFRLYPETRM